jgi:hypothetical protein
MTGSIQHAGNGTTDCKQQHGQRAATKPIVVVAAALMCGAADAIDSSLDQGPADDLINFYLA